MNVVKKKLRAYFGAALALTMLLSTLSLTSAAVAEETADPPPIRYMFANSFSGQAEIRVLGDINAVPITRKQSYGASIGATAIGQSRSFEFDVAAAGYYLISFQGYRYFSSGIGDLIIDGETIGQYDFYDPGSTYGPDIAIKTIELSAGTHELTLLVSGRNPSATQRSNYSLYPTALTLTPQASLAELQLTVDAKERLLLDEVVNLQASLTMTDGTAVNDPTYQYASSDPAVASVDADGNVTALAGGTTTVTVTATGNGQTLVKDVPIEVIDARLSSVTVTMDTGELLFGESAQLSVAGTLSDGTEADLTGASTVFGSSDPATVHVDEAGKVTAVRPGEADLTARVTFAGATLEDTLHVTVSDEIANAKTRSTIYTEERVAAARENVKSYDWAKSQRDAAVQKADQYLRNGIEFLWNIVPPQTLPRSYAVNQRLGSPVTGRDIDEYGNYPYQADPFARPWKIVDPSSGYTFPTNDFASFYESGLDEHGIFQRELADEQYLVNELYPEKGPTWGVDDGLGWVDAEGNHFPFIAYYVHWFLWHGTDSVISNANVALRDAYLYTGDMKYARAGIALLDRIADIYPSLDVSKFDQTVFLNSHGGLQTGKAVGSQWEELLIREFIHSYDAYFPVMDDPEVVAFLSAKAAEHQLNNPKNSGDAIRRNAEDGIVLQAYPAVRNAQIYSSNGRHANVLTQAAVVYDTMPQTQEWLDFAFQAGGLTPPPRQVLGGDILARLVDVVDRDGAPTSGAPEYNLLWLARYIRMADTLQGYDKYPAADLYDNVKFKKLFSNIYPLILSENYIPTFGDSKKTGDPGIFGVSMIDMVKAYQRYREPIFAQMAYFLNGNKLDGINGGMFATNTKQLLKDIKKVIKEHGPLDLPTDNLAGYGFAALRDGTSAEKAKDDSTMRDVWMYYGRNHGHGHRDTLNIGMHAFGLDLSPDLGYPEFADNQNMNRFQWVSNTISHNTVVVDESKQRPQFVAQPKHFDDGDRVELLDVEAPQVYPQTELYKRTTAMIKVDEANSYSVDFFRVKGGENHHFSFHGAEGSVTTDGLDLVAQPTGTYAGPDVEFGQRVDSVEGHLYQGHGFHWLKNVERSADPASGFSVDWKVEDTWDVYGNGAGAETDVHLRLTMLGDLDEVALADGVPPQNKPGNPEALRYLVAKRSGANLDSVFTSVIEPYKGERYIESVEQVSATVDGTEVTGTDVRAVKVTLADGRVDYIVNAMQPDVTYVIDDTFTFQGFFGVYSEKDGEQVYGYVNEGTVIGDLVEDATASVTGSVVDYTKTLSLENSITVKLSQPIADAERLVGSYIYVETDGERNGAYRIKGIASQDGDTVTLDIGDITLIRSYINPSEMSRGFTYNIAEGTGFVIPLATEVQAE